MGYASSWPRRLASVTLIVAATTTLLKPAAAQPTEAAGLVCSWEKLNDSLKDSLRGSDLTRESFLTAPLFKQIDDSGDAGVWREMIAQANLPLVAIGGYYALAEHADENTTFDAALRLMMSRPADVPLALYLSPLKILARAKGSDGELAAFQAQVVAGGPEDDEHFCQLLSLMPKSFLQSWYESSHLESARPTREAFVLSDLLAAVAASKLQETDRMRSRLWALRVYPGLPRYVYVMHVNPDSPDFDRYLTLVLTADQITGVKAMDATYWLLCVRRYRERIESLLASAIDLPANRKASLRALMLAEKGKGG